ncbi:MAG: CsgG/HfaB family protein [Acidobacteriota bacterium]|nr:CsgG/HfaB family protein [Acidobacteriota bacterium]
MKRIVSAFSLLVLLTAPAVLAQGNKPRVAVLEFKNKASHYTWTWYEAGRGAQDMLVTELVKSGKYRVIEREQLAAIMQEKGLSLSGDIDPRTAVKFGKMLGVEYLIAGAVTQLGTTDRGASVPGGLLRGLPSVNVRSQKAEAAVDARAFSTSTGEIVWADTAKDESSDASVFVAGAGGGASDHGKVDKILRPVVQKLASSFAKADLKSSGMGGHGDASGIVGKIANVEGGTLYLNAGSEGGVKEGDEFTVYRVGKQIKDPDTGEVLGADEVKVGRVKVTAVKGARLSTATAVSGSGFKAGDTLKN